MVIFNNIDLVVIGGLNAFSAQSSMYHFSCQTEFVEECQWKTLGQKLKYPRYDLVAIALPDRL